MNENENLVTEVTENVDATTTEETVEQVAEPEKVYTEDEFNTKLNEVSGKRASRKEAKMRKEYDRKYGELVNVLRAGTGVEDVAEITNTLRYFYSKKGIKFDKEATYSNKDVEVLAKADADEIIKYGYDEVVEEVDRLAEIGVDKMNAREKATFKVLADYREKAEMGNELAKIGVTENEYNTDEFKAFANKFNSNTSITDIWNIYNQTQPKKQIKPMGSIKNTTVDTNELKDFYTPEEAKRFTVKDLDDNPRLLGILEESMKRWKK